MVLHASYGTDHVEGWLSHAMAVWKLHGCYQGMCRLQSNNSSRPKAAMTSSSTSTPSITEWVGHTLADLQVRFSGSKEGLPVTSVRELTILQKARHPNIVSLLKVVTGTRLDRCVSGRVVMWVAHQRNRFTEQKDFLRTGVLGTAGGSSC